jgi:amino acid adenylation domain-containing protein
MLIKTFEEQVEKFPGKTAIETINRELSYSELNMYANRAARRLITHDRGVPGDGEHPTAALLFEHGADMIIGLLGALKADHIYVPLDAAFPERRLQYMLEHSGAVVILTNGENLALAESLAAKMNKPGDLSIINLDACTRDNRIPVDNIPREPSGEKPAYILYTSGSTGNPKGVLQSHGNILYFVRNWTQRFSISASDRLTLFSTICFDGAIPDIYSALLNGATLYPSNIKEEVDKADLGDWLVDREITLWHSVTTLFRFFVNTLRERGGNHPDFPDLRFIALGGEPLIEHDVTSFKQFFPHSTLANSYGQTESTLNSIWMVGAGDSFEQVLLGEPIGNTELLIMDEDGDIVEDFGVGEILVASDHSALGYWRDSEAGKKVFLDDPDLGRLYRTGDIGRLISAGKIEFLGRADNQVKIRGFRVEPGEIESHLSDYPGIRETVVLAGGDDGPGKYLCAYVTTDRVLEISGIREYLVKSLPHYMIPAYFVQVDKIPLTYNGKIDRRSLPAPEVNAGNVRTAPRNRLEKKLAAIYAELLGVDAKKIDVDANFFHLGGESAKAMVLGARIHRQLKVKLPLVEVFKRSTIRALAHYIKEIGHGEYASIEPAEEKEYYPLSSAQKRMYILQQIDPRHTAYNQPGLYEFVEPPAVERLELAFKKLIQRHEILRTAFRVVEGVPVQIVHREVRFAVEYVETTEEKSGRVFDVFNRSFDLARPPLLRVGVVNIENSRYLLMVDTHHIVSDFVSKMILMRDFLSLYYDGDLAALRLQYKDFAQWQNRPEQQEALKRQGEYWVKQFSGDIPVFDLPTDYPRPEAQSFEGDNFTFRMEEETTANLKALAVEREVTPYILLLCLYIILLYKLSGQEYFVVGTDISGRTHTDLQKIVGMFVNTLALKFYPTGTKTFGIFLEEMKKSTWEAFENKDYPFEKLVERVVKERDLSRNPLFDTVFFFNNVTGNSIPGDVEMEMGTDNPPLLVQTRYKKEKETTMFDLSLWVVESGDRLSFTFEYCTKLFRKEKIEAFATFYQEIAAVVLEAPNIALGEIEISLPLLAAKKEEEVSLDELNI